MSVQKTLGMTIDKNPDASPVLEPKRKTRTSSATKATIKRGPPSAATVVRRQRRTEDKRNIILSAALSLFSRYGMYGTSLDQVAVLADVSKTNLLYYFPNKEDLYLSVLKNLLSDWLEPFKALSADQDPREALGGYIRRKLMASRDNPEASRLFCLEIVNGAPSLSGVLNTELRELVKEKAAVVRAWIDQGLLTPIEPHHLFFSLWATTQHYADFEAQIHAVSGHTLKNRKFFEETVQSVQHIILDGLLIKRLPPAA